MKRKIVVIAHNIRSTHNIGSIMRTCDGLGASKLYISGYSPYPAAANENRLPHVAKRSNDRIAKTALGAENTVDWEHSQNIMNLLDALKSDCYEIVALEQSDTSQRLPSYSPPDKVALILGEEVNGVEPELLKICDDIIEIPMLGKKESLNVSVAAAIALYHLRFR